VLWPLNRTRSIAVQLLAERGVDQVLDHLAVAAIMLPMRSEK
jgi:hypothetical protein